MPHEKPDLSVRDLRGSADGAKVRSFRRAPGRGEGLLSRFRSCDASGFTLIELLVVIAIVITLAGLVLAAATGMQKNAARKKALTQINAIELGLEMFNRDNGEFPVHDSGSSLTGDVPELGAEILYQALSGDGNDLLRFYAESSSSTGKLGSSGTAYLEELDPKANPQGMVGTKGSGNYTVVDPWGQPYRYVRYPEAVDRRSNQRNVATYDLYTIGAEGKDEKEFDYKWLSNWD